MLVSINIALISKIDKDAIVLSNISTRLENDQLPRFTQAPYRLIFPPSQELIFGDSCIGRTTHDHNRPRISISEILQLFLPLFTTCIYDIEMGIPDDAVDY